MKKINKPILDPDPFSIAIAISTACSAAAAIGTFVRAGGQKKRKQKDIRNQLHKAYRALNSTQKCLRNFVSFIDQFGYLEASFRIASAPILGDREIINDLKRIYMESCYAGRDLIAAVVELSNLLDDNDAIECQKNVMKFDDFFRKAVTSPTYGQYTNTMDEFIIELKHVLNRIANRYDIQIEMYRG